MPGCARTLLAQSKKRARTKARVKGNGASGGAGRVEMPGTTSEGAWVATVTVKGAGEAPGVTEACETVQVERLGVPVHARETALEKPLTPETCRLYVADEPAVTEAEVEPPEAAARAKSVPGPLRLIGAGVLTASSVTVREPVRLPVVVGAKVTLKVQEAPGPMEVPQLLV